MVAPGAKTSSSSRTDGATNESLQARYEALALVEERFCNFDIVWAKVRGFPWWPGVLFHSWDDVFHAGIHTDPKIVAELVVPRPEKVTRGDTLTGEEESSTCYLKRHCLIMFLDKFNFSVLEINASNVAGFTTHYHLYERALMTSKNSKWRKMKAEFKRALVKATELLHMGKEYKEEELVLLEEPSVKEKKQRVWDVMQFDRREEGVLENAWDDVENEDNAAFSAGKEEEVAVEKKPARKLMVKKEKGTENKDMNEVVMLTPAKPRRQENSMDFESRARKRSRKEVYDVPHVGIASQSLAPIDLTETPEKMPCFAYNDKVSGNEAEKKALEFRNKVASTEANETELKSLRKGSARVLVMEDGDSVSKQLAEQSHIQVFDAIAKNGDGVSKQLTKWKNGEQVFDVIAGNTEEKEPNKLILTPLSSIWTTTGVSGDSSALSGEHMQLAHKQDFVWDDAVFTNELSIAEKKKAAIERKQAEDTMTGRERLSGKRQMRSFQQSQIRQNMMTGNLDPHTMVQCALYRPKDYVDDPNSRSRGGPMLDPPFHIVVHPDAVFVADLHAHLATCEIIGFLGGKWDEASKTLYIQAAFPCRSLVIDGDDGSTDVEMDPGSEIELRGIIENAQLEVVGWYHSHPAFAPDPSIRDIENQTSYQQLFQRPTTADNKPSEPFVGLIVGTYDTRRNTPVSLLRYFHTRGEKVSGGACREIYMPYELIPERHHFRNVLQDEEREKNRLFPMYQSILQHFNFKLAAIRYQLPVDIKVMPSRRAISRVSPTKLKGGGSTRKRKLSSNGTRGKPMKRARARRRRFVRSSSAVESQFDLTGAGGSQNYQAIQSGTLTPKDTLETGHNGSTDVVIKDETITPDGVCEEKRRVAIAVSSGGVELRHAGSSTTPLEEPKSVVIKEETTTPDGVCEEKRRVAIAVSSGGVELKHAGSSTTPVEEPKSEARSIDLQVAEVLADVVRTTEAANSSEKNERDLVGKPQAVKRINETLASGAEYNRLPAENGVASSPYASTVFQNVMQHTLSHSNEAVKGLPTQLDTDAIAELTDVRIPLPLSASFSSAVTSDVLPSASISVSSRKRTRKPNKTTKKHHRSTSPSSDRLSLGMAPCQTNSSGQAFYDAFRPSGPRFANGGIHEEVTPLFSRPDEPKGDTLLVEDVQYIVVDETIGMTFPSHCGRPSVKETDEESFQVAKTPDDDRIKQEIRRFVTSLVEKVAERVVAEIRTGTKLSAQGTTDKALISVSDVASGSIGSSTVKASINDVKMECTSMKPELIVNADVKNTTIHGDLQLFGSNGKCEDIQTSLQKMAGHLDKLQFSQTTMPSVATTKLQKDSTHEPEPELVVVRAKPKRDDSKAEQDHLNALRTKYGAGVSGCAEQVITLVDYYRDFERRTDLNEIWKARTTKLDKIESSLSEHVQYLNIPVALRRDFIKVART
ncbi:hypothetical protein KXD40_000660 [Peronospora effusa]|nr:hypothetical protein KXD40_000660 [Peronospora effusa]CAI5723531.1 unnamed protein product [Peronospora effusa]